jgi:hypothetical protein
MGERAIAPGSRPPTNHPVTDASSGTPTMVTSSGTAGTVRNALSCVR